LPACVVLSGGGVNLPGLIALAKERLRLPVRLAKPVHFEGISDLVDDPSFSVAMGLVLWGMGEELGGRGVKMQSSLSGNGATKKLLGWLKNFLP